MMKMIPFKRLFIYFSCLLAIVISSCSEEKASNDSRRSEIDGLQAPEGFVIERAADSGLVDYPMFASFDNRGRLFVFESDGSTPSTDDMKKTPVYFIRMLEDTNADGKFDRSKIFADSLTYPKGGVFYQGSLYVTSSPDFLKLTDTDNDGVADKKETILTGWVLNHNGALLGGPFFGPDGWMYLTDARRGFDITTKEGRKYTGSSAMIWRCKPDGTQLEPYCGGGYDNAVELAFMPSGETVGTMTYFTEPRGGFRDALMHWVEGGVYPKPLGVIAQDKYRLTGDLMPVMSKTARVAPSGVMRYRNKKVSEELSGNLFSAEFNTGRIMRHKVFADGATYRTEDEPFVTSTKTDIHLTDILEDADGSMLMLNTGGWFIAGCPLSRVAKTDIKGGIYRIRKNGTTYTNNWSTREELNTADANHLAEKFISAPPLVRDTYVELLVERGAASIASLKNIIAGDHDVEVRAAALFALSRIPTQEAMTAVRQSLNDKDPIVRTAAARSAGLAKDKTALPALLELVKSDDNIAVKRQAATAAGQMNDNRITTALVGAVENNRDRFFEHAVIYSLIKLNNPSALIAALQHQSADVKKAAIIALDQVMMSPIQKQHLAPLLFSSDTLLSNTAAWILTRQKGWPDVALKFINERLSGNKLEGKQREVVKNVMIAFSDEVHIQRYFATQLAESKNKSLVTEVIAESPVKTVPKAWIDQLSLMLKDQDADVVTEALQVIESRSIGELNNELAAIFNNTNASAELRLKTLGARIISQPALNNQEFTAVQQFLSEKYPAPLRHHAARILASAKLSNNQLQEIASQQLTKADVYLVPSLLSSFEGKSDAGVGQSVVKTLTEISAKLENISVNDIARILAGYPAEVKSAAAPLMKKLEEKDSQRLTHLQSVEKQLVNGDVSRGRKLFFGKALCSTCHAIGNEGEKFGPDLTNIGEIRSSHDILEAILYPNASFAREYETVKVTTQSTAYNGVIKEQFPDYIVLSTAPGQEIRIQQNEIKSIEPHNMSLMPPGLEKQLTPGELADLMSYLVSLPDGMSGLSGE